MSTVTSTVASSNLTGVGKGDGQPDISYEPNWEKYQARAARRAKLPNLPTTLPDGFPAELKGDLVWDGETLAETYKWTYELPETQLDEIEDALKHFKSLQLPLGHITPSTFPLPTLHPHLRRLSLELHTGHGFFVLRGLRVDSHSREDNIAIYAGVSSHIAPLRGRQDSQYQGNPADVVLAHVKDLTRFESKERKGDVGSPAHTADKQVFHTDSGDVVSLFALETAAVGGASRLASTWRVYNYLAETRPDLIWTLSDNWDVENFAGSNKRYTSRPLLFHQPAKNSPSSSSSSSSSSPPPERVALQYARRYFVGYGALPRSKDIPPITEAQAEALDALHFLGEKFSVATDFEKGDVQYVNNLAVFHARDGFTDTEEKRRHLLRFWLRDPEYAWETPPQLEEKWEQLYGGVQAEREVFPLEPYIRSESGKAR